jgi:hypothetical protein
VQIDQLLEMASIPHQIALAFCASFQHLDLDANLALRTSDCTHIFAPASLKMSPSMNNEQWAAHAQSLKAILSSFPVEAKEIFAQEGSNHITIWATSDARFRDDVKDEESGLDWSYYGEYIFVLQLNQAGDKIQRIVEFLDSKKVIDLGLVRARARANVAARKESLS